MKGMSENCEWMEYKRTEHNINTVLNGRGEEKAETIYEFTRKKLKHGNSWE